MPQHRDTHTPHPPTPEPRTLAEAASRAYDATYSPLTDADLERPDVIEDLVDRWLPAHLDGLRYLQDR